MYGKIFDSMYDGTLVEDWRALVTFQQMIVLCDADGTIDMTPSSLSRRTGIPIEHIKAGIEVLENPDPYSRTPDESGCRIVRLDEHRPWGWYIVNHKRYRDLGSQEDRRLQNRINKQKQRDRDSVSNGQRPSAMSAHTNTDTDTNTNTNTDTPKPPVVVDEAINPEAWAEYVQHRKEIKKKITPLSQTKQQNILRQFDFASQQKIVDTTVANGWTGLFPERLQEKGRKLTYAEQLASDMAEKGML